jgi:hypothetical protein
MSIFTDDLCATCMYLEEDYVSVGRTEGYVPPSNNWECPILSIILLLGEVF